MATVVLPSVRVELLRRLAWWRRYWRASADLLLPKFVPLFADPWEAPRSAVLLAARECAKLGEIEYTPSRIGTLEFHMVAITDRGAERFRTMEERADANGVSTEVTL